MKMRVFKFLCRQFAGTAFLFSGFVAIGTSLVLLGSSSLGYLPYSDRPGPGWWGRVHWPSWAEFLNYIGFAPWFAYFCLFFGARLFALSLILGFASTPKWLNRIIGGIIAALAAGLAVMGAGWYLALAEIGPDAAIVLGLAYGVFLFPHFIERRSQPVSIWVRTSLVACATALFLYWIISPFLPKRPTPTVNFDLMRATSGNQPITTAPYDQIQISRELSVLNLRGETHGGIAQISNQGGPHIDVELIALEPIKKEARLAIPRTGYVVYVLKDSVWTAHPSISEKDKRTLTIEPGINATYDGGRVKLGKERDFTAFTWYPVILRGQ